MSSNEKDLKNNNTPEAKDENLYKGKIGKKELVKTFFRSVPMEHSYNYERMMNVGYCYAMIPSLKKIYGEDTEEFKRAMQRHLEFYNTTPHVITLPLGISVAMEEKRAEEIDTFETESITNVKTALMGPLAGIGDSIFWGALKIFATGIGTSLAMQGSILGPILFLLVYNIPHFALRYWLTFVGYKFGTDFLDKVEKSGVMSIATHVASIVGLMVAGAMTAEMVFVNIAGEIGVGEEATTVQGLFDGIIPGLIPLALFGIVYFLLKKKWKPAAIMLILLILGIAGAYFGFLGVAE